MLLEARLAASRRSRAMCVVLLLRQCHPYVLTGLARALGRGIKIAVELVLDVDSSQQLYWHFSWADVHA